MFQKCIVSKIDPDDYKKLEDFTITYGIVNTKFGKCLMGMHKDEICFLSFIDGFSEKSCQSRSRSGGSNGISELQETFPNARLDEKNGVILKKVQEIFDEDAHGDVKILLKGSAFQTRIWVELLKIKKGATTTYEDIAKAIGHPKAARAVASAIAKNNICYLVPCHRVISKNKALNRFRWGAERKVNMLRFEESTAKRELINKLFKNVSHSKDK